MWHTKLWKICKKHNDLVRMLGITVEYEGDTIFYVET